MIARRTVLAVAGAAACARPAVRPPPAPPAVHRPASPPPWRELFDGEALGDWAPTPFGGEGRVEVRDGALVLDVGEALTGVTWRGAPPPRVAYELEVEARRVAGDDFFCGLTFPVADTHASLIVGGWHGPVVGISSLDGADASENETKRLMSFERGRWYRVRVRVTTGRIAAWIDDTSVVDVSTVGREVGIRNEMGLSRPLGLAAWRTKAEVRAIRLRVL